jgi:putative ABC transport system permease protein
MVFLAAGVLALIIALATVAGHALLVARAKPVEALRYE